MSVSGVTVLPLVDSHIFNQSCGLCHIHSHTLTHIHGLRGRNETFTVKPADLKAPSLTVSISKFQTFLLMSME